MSPLCPPGRPVLGPHVPQRTRGPARGLASLGLRAMGWGFSGVVPDVGRCVAIVAPHTSNWDFVIGLLGMLSLGLDAHWLGKREIFRGLFGPVFRWFGGIPVDRGAAGGVVLAAIQRFRETDRLVLGLSPEGTRKRVERWKSGFHRIAVDAGVPVLPIAFDYRVRRLTFLPLFTPTGDFEADMAALRGQFTSAMAKRPDAYVP